MHLKVIILSLAFVWLDGCSTPAARNPAVPPVKNVIMIIGDGMGPQQIGLLLSYAHQAPNGILKNRKTALERLSEDGVIGISLTHPDGALVTDSAASATQLATGKFAKPEMVGLDAEGRRSESVIEKAKRWGKATGLVSDTRITHATPASFAAHEDHRSNETAIPEGLLDAGADVMFSGGLDYWLPQAAAKAGSPIRREMERLTERAFEIGSARRDDRNLLADAQKQGYRLVFNTRQLKAAHGKTLGLFAGSGMSDGITESRNRQKPDHAEPTLAEMSEQALKILDRDGRGFFLMIESGQIDWAGHRNDAGLLLHEMLRFDAMLNTVLDWMAGREDTLLIVTADHETGGFGFSYSNRNVPAAEKLASGHLFKPDFNFGNPEILDRLYAQSLSHHDMLAAFDALPPDQRSPARLAAQINQYSAFKIGDAEAAALLASQPQTAGEKAGSNAVFGAKSAFFVYTKDNRENLLGELLGPQQQVVWASGTHTSTPVLVFAGGHRRSSVPFGNILHHTEVGRLTAEALNPSLPED